MVALQGRDEETGKDLEGGFRDNCQSRHTEDPEEPLLLSR